MPEITYEITEEKTFVEANSVLPTINVNLLDNKFPVLPLYQPYIINFNLTNYTQGSNTMKSLSLSLEDQGCILCAFDGFNGAALEIMVNSGKTAAFNTGTFDYDEGPSFDFSDVNACPVIYKGPNSNLSLILWNHGESTDIINQTLKIWAVRLK